VRSRLQVVARRRPARGGFADLHPDQLLVRRAALRMGFTVALAVAVVAAVLTVAALLVLLRDQRAAASTLLANTVARADDVGDPPSGMWLAIRSGQGTAVTRGMPPGLPDRAALENRSTRLGEKSRQRRRSAPSGASCRSRHSDVRRGPFDKAFAALFSIPCSQGPCRADVDG